jgi:deazaflavin-dependent oxidoreductase (nitroreductase family)
VPNIRWLLALITRLHTWLYLWSGGRLGHRAPFTGWRTLLLTQRGRVTGKERTLPLLYVEDGGRWVVVGSNAGDDRDPAWCANLRATPGARVRVGAREHAVRARFAEGDERERLWRKLVAAFPDYARYERGTARRIPVVALEPSPRIEIPGSDP